MDEAQRELVTQAESGARHSGARQSVLHPLIELTLARVRESVRQPEAIFWSFVFPALLAIALGIAFRNAGPEKNRVAVISSVANATETAAALSRSADLEAVVMTPDEAALALRTGKVALIVQSGIPAAGASISAFDYRFDPTRPESRLARLAVDDALQRAAGRSDVAAVREIPVTETVARYIDFLIPGLLGLNLLSSGMWSVGFSIVHTRSQRLLKRLAATPMRRWQYLMSFILSRLIFLALEIIAILGFAWLLFGVTMHGSLLSFILIAIIGSMVFCGMGLLIAARTKTIEGASGWMNVVMMPMWLLSGSFFSAARFPDFAQPFIRLLPLTALNDALRAVMNEGASLAANTGRIAVMLAWGLVSFIIALRIFRWQ